MRTAFGDDPIAWMLHQYLFLLYSTSTMLQCRESLWKPKCFAVVLHMAIRDLGGVGRGWYGLEKSLH